MGGEILFVMFCVCVISFFAHRRPIICKQPESKIDKLSTQSLSRLSDIKMVIIMSSVLRLMASCMHSQNSKVGMNHASKSLLP